MTREESYVEHILQAGEGLAGLTLEQLGFEPRLEDLTTEQRTFWDPMTSNGWIRSRRSAGTGAC